MKKKIELIRQLLNKKKNEELLQQIKSYKFKVNTIPRSFEDFDQQLRRSDLKEYFDEEKCYVLILSFLISTEDNVERYYLILTRIKQSEEQIKKTVFDLINKGTNDDNELMEEDNEIKFIET